MMTSAEVVETSVNVITNSPSQDYIHPDDHTSLSYEKKVYVNIESSVNLNYNI